MNSLSQTISQASNYTIKLASSNHISWHAPVVSREMREAQNAHKSFVLWFTGLSGAGKSTLSHYIEEQLHHQGYRTCVLDGDNVRHGLCADLGFSLDDRHENIRRIGEACKLFVHSGVVVLTAFISPLKEDRDKARALVGDQVINTAQWSLAECADAVLAYLQTSGRLNPSALRIVPIAA